MARSKSNNSQEIKIQQPIKVEILSSKQTTKIPTWYTKLALVISILMFIISLVGLALFITYKTEENKIESTDFNGTLLIDRPSLVSLRDPFTVKIVLINQNQDELNGTIRLTMEPENVVSLGIDGINSVNVENLPSGSSLTHTYTFIPLSLPPAKSLLMKIQFDGLENSTVNLGQPDWKIRVIGITHLKAALAWILSGSGLITTFIGLFWNLIKKNFPALA